MPQVAHAFRSVAASVASVAWAAAVAVGGAGCSPRHAEPRLQTAALGSTAWSTSLDRDHPLVGKVWDVRGGAFVSPEALLRALEGARFVLLGEKHDNPDHHRLQAAVVEALVASGRRPAVAFEMIAAADQDKVNGYRAGKEARAAGLGSALSWDKSGWPPYDEYLPIFDAAFRGGLAVVGANLPHEQVRGIVREGLAALTPADVRRLALDQPMPAALEGALRDEMKASHCGHLPEGLLGPMAFAQRARDGQMADSLRSADSGQGTVLIAGAGHARRDRGVPWVLGLGSDTSAKGGVVSLAFEEVEKGTVDPRAYGARFGAHDPPFDFVWFTPRATDEDPCAAFGSKP